jgi:putative membrane protein
MADPIFDPKNEKSIKSIVWVISIAIPMVVAGLIVMPQTGKLGNFDVSLLPALNATFNSLTALCLVCAFFAIKSKNITIHKRFMVAAFVLSSLFLVSYVLYHFQSQPTRYGDVDHDGVVDAFEKAEVGIWRLIYFLILVIHIVLAAVILPFILLTFYYSLSNQIEKHKKIVRFTFPVWLFVAVSGVVVYFMIRPYYF